ncbi:hypothetical protein ADK65_04150 [Streptomyces sp. NRRL B-1140]|nr:hypothetical protein ADK65_04150 [Streptomyces sp. NRRL B-1140]
MVGRFGEEIRRLLVRSAVEKFDQLHRPGQDPARVQDRGFDIALGGFAEKGDDGRAAVDAGTQRAEYERLRHIMFVGESEFGSRYVDHVFHVPPGAA